jgi:hypothetical protein
MESPILGAVSRLLCSDQYAGIILTIAAGWLTFFAWVSGCALTPFVLGTMVEGMIIFNNDDFVPKRWHTTLLAWAFMIVPVIWNVGSSYHGAAGIYRTDEDRYMLDDF